MIVSSSPVTSALVRPLHPVKSDAKAVVDICAAYDIRQQFYTTSFMFGCLHVSRVRLATSNL